MMLKIMIILLASDDQGITFKLHLLGRLFAWRVARNLKLGGGCFGGVTPNWDSLNLELKSFFCLKLGKDQKKEKKGVRPRWDRVLQPSSFLIRSQSGHILIANANGSAIFAFRAKIGFKSNKNKVFCILCMPMGGQPHPTPFVYATTFSCDNRHFAF